MGKLSKKLFKKNQSIPRDKAVKIGVETYYQKREADINRARFDMIVMFLLYLHNDCGYGGKRLRRVLEGLMDFLIGINKYPGDPIISMQEILKDEADFDILQAYNEIVKNQGAISR